jgi:acetylornithine deacetylase
MALVQALSIGRGEVGRILADLVAIPSVNPLHQDRVAPPYGEAGVAAYVEDFGRSLDLRCERQEVLPGRENVLVHLDGAAAEPPLLWECHMDTVPGWEGSPDPFEPRIEEGKLFGRGACDVKGTLAAMLAALRVVARGQRPERGIILAATVDEEHQARGVHRLAAAGLAPAAAIVGEPTRLAIVVAHKGCVRWKVATRGRSVHSSNALLGVNAIDRMVEFLADLQTEIGPALAGRASPLVGSPSLSVCTIHGGVAVNVIPDRCVVEIDRRTIPGETTQAVDAEFRALVERVRERHPGLAVEVEPPFVADPSLGTSPDEPIVRELTRALETVVGSARVIGVPFGTDAGKLSQAGIPSVVFGPGDIDLAHTVDEHVDLDEVARAAQVLALVALKS